eukprot:Transcript_10181.p3 GENE.Transcript_10181~~Transcript_10181.p3  ORF type:complete len:303 (-),score=83.11 Transcript_10181:348-1256(-)
MRKATPVSDGLLSASDAQPPSEMPEIEARHVKDVYDSIAREWHGTRYKSWPRVEEFVLSLPRGSLVADLGCGNGKMAPACRQGGHFALGIDISIELVRICAHEQAMEVARPTGISPPSALHAHLHGSPSWQAQAADVMQVPYRSGVFDAALSIAVLHHVSSEPRRRLLLAETLRVLRPGGLALVYAWAMEQAGGRSGHTFASQDVFVPFHQRAPSQGGKQPAAAAAAGEESGAGGGAEAAAAPEQQAVVHQRYCHVYREGELRRLVESVPGASVVQEYYDTGNHCVLVRKGGEAEEASSCSG